MFSSNEMSMILKYNFRVLLWREKTRVVRYPPSPLRFICFNELNNIWGLWWHKRLGPAKSADPTCSLLLFVDPCHGKDSWTWNYRLFWWKGITALPFGSLWIYFPVVAKNQLLWVKGGLWTLVRFSQEGLLFSIPIEAGRNRHPQVHLGNNGMA